MSLSSSTSNVPPARLALLTEYLSLPSSHKPITSTVSPHHALLAQLYPAHPSLVDHAESLAKFRRRIPMLKRAIADQTRALAKLNDAANLLLLVREHVRLLRDAAAACDSPTTRIGCWGEGTVMCFAGIPGHYRVRYLRRCWGYAADAVETAVEMSSFLKVQCEKEGTNQLVPGIEKETKWNAGLVELWGGVTLVFRSDVLKNMAEEATRMREAVMNWGRRQRKFVVKIRRELARTKKKLLLIDEKVMQIRKTLLLEEFGPHSFPTCDSLPTPHWKEHDTDSSEDASDHQQ